MQLRNARLCLDCEEVHEESHCPICASEAFTYVTRWVPAADRRPPTRSRTPVPAPALDDEASPRRVSRLVTGGALGLAVLATARWLLRGSGTERSANGSATERASRS